MVKQLHMGASSQEQSHSIMFGAFLSVLSPRNEICHYYVQINYYVWITFIYQNCLFLVLIKVYKNILECFVMLWPIFVYCIVSMIWKWWFSYKYDADVLLWYQDIFSFIKLYLVACDLYFDSHKLLYLIIPLIFISYFICINCIIVREYHRYSLTANKSLF